MTLLSTPIRGQLGIIFDTETHNKDNPRIIESAYGYVDPESGQLDVASIVVERFNPGELISFGAMSAHHILDQDLVDCPPSHTFALPADVGYIIGHNVEFDMTAAGNPEGYRTIDTLALARKAWPEQNSHTQSALFYQLHSELGLDMNAARDFVRGAHSAGVDIQMCSFIFNQLLEIYLPKLCQIDEYLGREISLLDGMHLLSAVTQIPMIMGFGKYHDLAPHKVPANYKNWYLTDAENTNLYIKLAMTEGGATEEGKALFKLAHELYGHESPDPVKPLPVESKGQRFTFG